MFLPTRSLLLAILLPVKNGPNQQASPNAKTEEISPETALDGQPKGNLFDFSEFWESENSP
jgi:hypothetical protein